MSHTDPMIPTRRHEVRGSGGGTGTGGSSTSVDACDVTLLTPAAEATRLSVGLHDDDDDNPYLVVTAPLLSRIAGSGHSSSDHHDRHHLSNNSNNNSFSNNSSDVHSRGVSPQSQPSLSSPCTDGSVCVAQPPRLPRWSPQLDVHHPNSQHDVHHESADGSTVSDFYAARSRHVDNISFASAVRVDDRGGTLPLQSQSATFLAERQSPSSPLRRPLSVIMPSITAFREHVHGMSWARIAWVMFLVALVMVGNFMQIVMLNFWLISFPSDGAPGNYTAFAMPGIFFAMLFVLLLGAYAIIRRPSLRFATHLHGWAILVGIGFCDAFSSWMATYAASYTSEVLQALFTNLCPLYAVFLSKWILRDTRRYANVYIASVFVLTILGILTASLYGLIKDRNASEGKWWILIFFLSMPVRVLMNVWQSLYMVVYTHDENFTSWLRVHFSEMPSVVDAAEEEAEHTAIAATKDGESDVAVNGFHHVVMPASTPYANQGVKDRETHDALGVISEPDSDLAVPIITITPPTSTAQAQKLCPKEHSVMGAADDDEDEEDGAALLPSPMVDEPIVDDVSAVAVIRVKTVGERRGGGEEVKGSDGDALSSSTAGDAAPPLPAQMFAVRYNQGEDTIVKLVMLAGETFIQMCFTLALLPADALPWWGNSATVAATWGNFREGLRCVFTIQSNFVYCFLYSLGFVFTYVGCAYLNHYSAALCSIVSQLSSPVTALMLVIEPSWNVQEGGDSPWYCNVVAIVFLVIAALLYVLWEEMTDHEKVLAEYALKMKELHVLPASHKKPHPVGVFG